MKLISPNLIQRLESEDEIADIADRILRNAGVSGVLPTPIDKLLEAKKITCVSDLDDLEESYLSGLGKKARHSFQSAMQKLRGIADLRQQVVYVASSANGHDGRTRFVQGHELGHQVLRWHHVDPTYFDDNQTLSPRVQDEFEREANFFSAEVIFQGDRFKKIALDYRASLDAIFTLADMHGASRQATLWRYAEAQDEKIAVVQYYPSNVLDTHGEKVLQLWKTIPSEKFNNKYNEIGLPDRIRSGHPWVAARDLREIVRGDIALDCGGVPVKFQWEAFWNNHALLVFLRRGPLLHVIGKTIGKRLPKS